MHDRSLAWLGTGTSIKSVGVKPVLVKLSGHASDFYM
jgi:hypothetical protein